MIDEKLLGELRQGSDPTERVSVVVEWTAQPALHEAVVTSRRQLQKDLEREYGRIKHGLLLMLRRDDEVTVEDFPGSSKAIVTATRKKLSELVAKAGLDRSPDVRLIRNLRFEAS